MSSAFKLNNSEMSNVLINNYIIHMIASLLLSILTCLAKYKLYKKKIIY